ncbi:unnamed protein product, partial [marine sediment metagenome]
KQNKYASQNDENCSQFHHSTVAPKLKLPDSTAELMPAADCISMPTAKSRYH